MCCSLVGILLVSLAAAGDDSTPACPPHGSDFQWLLPDVNWTAEPVEPSEKLLVRGLGMADFGIYAFVDYMSLQHVGSGGSIPLLARDSDNGTAVDANQIQFPMGFGPRVGLVGSGLLFGFDLDAGYFNIPEWSASRSADDLSGLHMPLLGTTGPLPAAANFNYVSRMQSAEISVGWSLAQIISITGGFRWLQLREDLGCTGVDNSGASFGLFDAQVNNDLYNFQLGLTAWLPLGAQLSVGGDLKGGVGADVAEHTFNGTVDNVALATTERGTHLCYFGEADVALATMIIQNVYVPSVTRCCIWAGLTWPPTSWAATPAAISGLLLTATCWRMDQRRAWRSSSECGTLNDEW